FGSKASLLIAKSAEWPSLVFGFSLLLLGSLTILFSLAIRTVEERKSFFYFGWVLLLLGGWVFSQTPSKFLLIRNPALPMNLSFASLYLLPLFLTNYIIHSYPVRRTIKLFQRFSLLFITLYVVAVLLQMAGTMQLTDLLLISGLSLALFLVSLFCFIIHEYIKGNNELASFIFALSCLLCSILAEVVLLMFHISLNSAVILHAGMALAAAILFMHSVALVRQKTQVLSKEEVLLSLAYNDALTKVGSRTSYELELQRITNNQSAEPIGILMMDINDLKMINDRFGHTKGDLILKDFAQRLRQLLPHHSKIYRYGGDEFIAFIPQVSEEGIQALAYKVQTYFQSSQKTEYQVAVGYDRYVPKTKEKIAKVVSRADRAMYHTKNKMKAFGSS
ncbi:MAG: GGDEF domain-containing protein, partial [Spirochaetia bacterium]|nr:GGDEF domain-containing protein [Spirochaetia bacterium]